MRRPLRAAPERRATGRGIGAALGRAAVGLLALALIAGAAVVLWRQLDPPPALERTLDLAPGEVAWLELPTAGASGLRLRIVPRDGAPVSFIVLRGEASLARYRDGTLRHAAQPRPDDDNWGRDFLAMLAEPDFRYLAELARLQFPYAYDAAARPLEPDRHVLVIDNTTFAGGGREPVAAELRVWAGGGR